MKNDVSEKFFLYQVISSRGAKITTVTKKL